MEQAEKDVEAALQNVSFLLNAHLHFFYIAATSYLLYQMIRVYNYIYLCSPILGSVTVTARGADYCETVTVSPMKYRQQYRRLRALLFDQCVGPTEFMLAKVVRQGLRFIFFIRED